MPSAALHINQIAIDSQFYIWGSGEDIRKFNGTGWDYFDWTNSAVPSGAPYSLDTRSVSMDPYDNLWCGVAEGPTSGYSNSVQTAVFWIDTNNVSTGKSWKFSDLGDFNSVPQETSLVYACPFGDDVFAFVTPLNGVGGTAGISNYTRFSGVTGGRLFYYLKETDQWKETIPGYIWPHIYDIETKGLDGKSYCYYLATSEGMIRIPQGTLSLTNLTDGTQFISQATYYNTHTSGIPSDSVYCLDRDENGNIWVGTLAGLSFFDGYKFWNQLGGYTITSIKSRPNGHVFFAMNDPELNEGTGLWHFNGDSVDHFDTSNSTIASDNIISIELINHNTKLPGLEVHQDSFWILGYNTLSVFDYDIPHIYASSNYAGATGWNFTYYSATAGIPLPNVNKYTWEYPDWQVYQNKILADKHPGLDPRNLFLTAPLSDISDGKAGKQAYWDNYPIPSYDQDVHKEKIDQPEWETYNHLSHNGGTRDVGFFTTCSTTLEVNGETKLFVGGYVTGNANVFIGTYNNRKDAFINNLNPTLGGTSVDDSESTYDFGDMGFIIEYNSKGYVDSIIPFRGYNTRVDSIAPSNDGNSIIITGTFDWLIENGPYIYSGCESFNIDDVGSPNAASTIGLTNKRVKGINTDYPWIYPCTYGDDYFGDGFGYTGGTLESNFTGTSSTIPTSGCTFLDADDNVASSFESVKTILFNKTTSLGSLSDLDPVFYDLPSGYSIYITDQAVGNPYLTNGEILAYFTISGVATNNDDSYQPYPIGTIILDVIFQEYGPGYNLHYYYNQKVGFNSNSYYNNCFPLLRNIPDLRAYVNSGISAPGVFVAEIGKDLGDSTSFSGFGDDFDTDIRKSYRITNFRTFPSVDFNPVDAYSSILTQVDVNDYSINIILNCNTTGSNSISTLKNQWYGIIDSDSVPDYISDSNGLPNYISYLKLNKSNFSLQTVKSSSGATSGFYIQESNQLNSMKTNNTCLITGMSDSEFTFCGIDFKFPPDHEINSTYPYFLIVDSDGNGITGRSLNTKLITSGQSFVESSKSDSRYYVISPSDKSVTFFGKEFILDESNYQLLIAEINEQGTPLKVFSTPIDMPLGIPGYNKMLANGQLLIASWLDPSHQIKIRKIDTTGRTLDEINFGEFYQNPSYFSICTDSDSNFYVSVYNYGAGVTGGYIPIPENSGFVFKVKQYEPELGINMGNIISRPGSGAWTWCDVHSSDGHLEIPLMSTVIFNNYSSAIYGKRNNVWSLLNSITGEDLLTMKETPYFIYTFSTPGYYTITNQVEDSEGNVYEISKPGFIQVIDHKVKRADDPQPDFVNSADYGYDQPKFTFDYEFKKLTDDLASQEAQILLDNEGQFGSAFVIPGNPDATFTSP